MAKVNEATQYTLEGSTSSSSRTAGNRVCVYKKVCVSKEKHVAPRAIIRNRSNAGSDFLARVARDVLGIAYIAITDTSHGEFVALRTRSR